MASYLAPQHALGLRDFQHPPEYRSMHVERQSLANPGQTRMVRGRRGHLQPEKGPPRQTIGALPGDRPLRGQSLEVAHQQHPKYNDAHRFRYTLTEPDTAKQGPVILRDTRTSPPFTFERKRLGKPAILV